MIRPCPCCGSSKLYEGATDASGYGVQCRRCGLTLARPIASEWPKGTMHLKPDARLLILERRALARARRAWNRRANA